jgi:hypothetical protein
LAPSAVAMSASHTHGKDARVGHQSCHYESLSGNGEAGKRSPVVAVGASHTHGKDTLSRH